MAKLLNTRVAGLSLAILSAPALPVAAQSLLDAAPVISRAAPGASESILSTRVAVADTARKASRTIVPFEQSAGDFRLAGEDDLGRFSFYVSPEQVSAGGSLALSYKNAVSVLPDSSVMDVEVNGRKAGSFRIASPNGFTAQNVTIPADLLKAGRNQVSIRARQFHRVDCSLEATYELWSEIDPAESGFVPAKMHGFSSFDDLLTMPRTQDGVTDVRLIMPQTASGEMLNDAAPALQTLSLFLNRDDIVVTVGDKPGTGPGIDLYVLTDKTAAQSMGGDADIRGLPYGLSVKDGAEGRARVSLRGATKADLGSQLLAAVRGPLKESFDSGIFSPRNGALVAEASTSYKLSDTGYQTRVFSGRLSRTAFDMVMPADFYPADYATIGIKLHAATSPGLERTAQFLVRVNDLVVTSYPFRNEEGEQFDGRLIELPLRAFRPGMNKVELLAELPVAADAVCNPDGRDVEKPRFILLQDTEIEIPALARIGRLPDIGALAGTGYPFADGRPFDLVVERANAQTASAALTMLSRLALSARNPLNADIKLGAAANTSKGRNALVIAAAETFADAGNAAKSAFPPLADAASANDGTTLTDPFQTAAIEATIPFLSAETDAQDEESGALLDAFRKSTVREQDQLSLTSKAGLWLSTAGMRFGQWLNYDAARTDGMKQGASLVTLSQTPSPDGEATWTVIRGQSSRDIEKGVRRLVEPAVWNHLSGGSARIETASLSATTLPATTHFISGITDQTPGNARRLAAAWFSDNFQFYVLLVVVLMGIFAIWLGRTIPRKGVRSDQ